MKEKAYTVLITALATLRVAFEAVRRFTVKTYHRVRANKTACKALRILGVCLLVFLILFADALVSCRYAEKKANARYEVKLAEYNAEQEALKQEAIDTDPYTIQLNEEAEELARVLYGVKDNSTDDLKTYCWCVFNRVDNKAFPSTVSDVIAQPNQWMRYDKTNPVLENLYQLAREQLDAWHTDSHRPVSSDYVFMNWSSNDIVLRDNFHEGSGTHYWRWNQK